MEYRLLQPYMSTEALKGWLLQCHRGSNPKAGTSALRPELISQAIVFVGT